MIGFTKRNLKVFFRDKASVLMSLLAVFVIIGLHVLFLGDIWATGFSDVPDARQIMDSFTMAGLLAVTSVTTAMGVFGIMIADKAQKIMKDFYSSPIKKSKIAGGYILSAFIVGFLMSVIAFVFAQLYIVADGGEMMSLLVIIKILALLVLAAFTNTAIVFFIVSFFKSTNAFATASTIIGTLIGFITGIYLPIGTLPEAVQWVVKLFPVSHAAALMRQVMTAKALDESFAGASAQTISEFKETLGITFHFGDHVVTSFESIIILLITAILFYGLAIYNVSRKRG